MTLLLPFGRQRQAFQPGITAVGLPVDKAVFFHAGEDIGHCGTTDFKLLLNIPLVDRPIRMMVQILNDKAVHGRYLVYPQTAEGKLHVSLQHIVQLANPMSHMKSTCPLLHKPLPA